MSRKGNMSIFHNNIIALIVYSICLYCPLLAAVEPWGQDADMVSEKPPETIHHDSVGFNTIITFHQRIVSPADGPRSHFYPSSSQYMRLAIRKYGFFTGFCMGCDRLMRENSDPWFYSFVQTKDGQLLKLDPP